MVTSRFFGSVYPSRFLEIRAPVVGGVPWVRKCFVPCFVSLALWVWNSRSGSPSGSHTKIPLMFELEIAGMVMNKPLDSHHCHVQLFVLGKAVTAVALVILVPAEIAFVFVATSSIRSAAVPTSTALVATREKGAEDLIATWGRVSHPSFRLRIWAKEFVTNLQTPSEESHRRAVQLTRTSVGCLPPTSCDRPCLTAHYGLSVCSYRQDLQLSQTKKIQNSRLKIFQHLSEQYRQYSQCSTLWALPETVTVDSEG